MFKSVEFAGARTGSVMASVLVHAALIGAVVTLPLLLLDPPKGLKTYDITLLAPPPPQRPILEVTLYKAPTPPAAPVSPVPPLAAPAPVAPPPEPKRPEAARPEPRIVEPQPIAPPVVMPEPKRDVPDTLKPVVPEPKRDPVPVVPIQRTPTVRTDVFAAAPASTATTHLPARQIQTGGFGDPNGIKGEGKPDRPTNIASLGAFDLPVGAGAGNGSGGARGTRGVVASGGFDQGPASDSTRRTGAVSSGGFAAAATAAPPEANGRAIQSGGFGDLNSSAAPSSTRRKTEVGDTAVEVTFKPRPDYTKDARAAKLEGEVWVRVQFLATGQMKIVGVERGLGHGLDETAVRAAEGIRFKPATRNGSPVDSAAVVRIVFQLAN